MWQAMLLGLASPAVAAAAPVSSAPGCFWTYPRDLPLVETNVRYWRGDFRLRPGERVELAGSFPRARQFGFNVHRAADNGVVGGTADVDIMPMPGSINPFRAGAQRLAQRRAYRVAVAPGAGLAGRTVGPGAIPDEGFAGRILMRLYLPDKAAPGGGVALSDVFLIQASGARVKLTSACPDPATVDTAQPLGPTKMPQARGIVRDPLDWRSSGAPQATASGDLMVNRDNAYAYAYTDFAKGEILVLKGRAPTHPKTFGGTRPMGTGQVRYWSLCAYRHPSDRSASCLADEEIPLDSRGGYTVVISPADRRPANARIAYGVAWLDATTAGEGLALLRFVAPSPAFRFAPAGAAGSSAAATLGPYGPVGRYSSRAAFAVQRWSDTAFLHLILASEGAKR